MLDLRQYASLGAALRDALERWPNETCLIEADRDREKMRLTYSDFKEMARPLCRALEDSEFKAGDRAAIIMTNELEPSAQKPLAAGVAPGAAAVLGGIESPLGAVVGGIIVGVTVVSVHPV